MVQIPELLFVAILLDHTMAKQRSTFTKLYYFYIYTTPIGTMTTGETIIFNLVVLFSLFLACYWAIAIFPSWVMSIGRIVYYYLIGSTMPFSLALLLSCSFKFPSKISSNSNVTRMERQ